MNKKISVYKKMPRFCEKQYIDNLIISKKIEGNVYTAINQLAIYFLTHDDRINPIPEDLKAKDAQVLIQEKIDRVYSQILNIIKYSTTEYELIRREEQTKRIIKQKILEGYDPIANVEKIYIYQEDLDYLKTIDDMTLQKLLFSIICYLRFIQVKYRNESLWSNFDQRLFFKSAGIRVTLKQQNLIMGDLIRRGLIRSSYQIDRTSFYATFMENIEPKTVVAEINNFEELGIEYNILLGQEYITCLSCGKRIPKPKDRDWGLCNRCKRLSKYKSWKTMKLKKCSVCNKYILVMPKDNQTKMCEKCYHQHRRLAQAKWVANKRGLAGNDS